MAENKLSPEIAQALMDRGILQPDVASAYMPAPAMATPVAEPAAPIAAEDVLMQEEALNAPTAPMQTEVPLAQRVQDEEQAFKNDQNLRNQERFKKTKEEISKRGFTATSDAKQKLELAALEQMDLEDERAAQEEQNRIQVAQAEAQKKLEDYKKTKNLYLKRNLPFEEDAAMEDLISMEVKALETPEQIQIKQVTPEMQAIEEEAKMQRADNARMLATEKVVKEQQTKVANEQKRVATEIKERDSKVAAEAAEEGDTDIPFGSKLGFIIAAAIAGGAGGRNGTNGVIEIYKDKIKQKAEAKAAKIKDAQEKAKTALDYEKFEWQKAMDRLKAQGDASDSEYKKAQIKKMEAETFKIIKEIEAEQATSASGDYGITPDQYNKAKDKSTFIRVGDKFYDLGNSTAAKEMREPLTNFKTVDRSLSQLREIINSSPYQKGDITGLSGSVRERGLQAQQALIGLMRVDLFGPGVLTDKDMDRAKAIIPSGTSAKQIVNPENAQELVYELGQKALFARNQKLEQFNIAPPVSANQANIDRLMSKYPDKFPQIGDAITYLIQNKKWAPEK